VLLSAALDSTTDKNVMGNFTHDNIGRLLTCRYRTYDAPQCVYIVVAALIPTEGHLESEDTIEFPPPQTSFSLFGPKTPSIRIPTEPILNQTRRKGKY